MVTGRHGAEPLWQNGKECEQENQSEQKEYLTTCTEYLAVKPKTTRKKPRLIFVVVFFKLIILHVCYSVCRTSHNVVLNRKLGRLRMNRFTGSSWDETRRNFHRRFKATHMYFILLSYTPHRHRGLTFKS